MNLFNAIFGNSQQKAASKINTLFDYDDTFINITMGIKKARDYNDMKAILSSISKFKQRYCNNTKVKDDAESLHVRLEQRFTMLEAAGL